MRRRDLIKEAALFPAAMAANADVPEHLWQGFDFGSAPVRERLNQGPFDIGQDQDGRSYCLPHLRKADTKSGPGSHRLHLGRGWTFSGCAGRSRRNGPGWRKGI